MKYDGDMDKYSLNELIEIFEKHAIQNEKQIKENIEKFPEGNYAKDDFNICKALHSICYEIDQLKNGRNTR